MTLHVACFIEILTNVQLQVLIRYSLTRDCTFNTVAFRTFCLIFEHSLKTIMQFSLYRCVHCIQKHHQTFMFLRVSLMLKMK